MSMPEEEETAGKIPVVAAAADAIAVIIGKMKKDRVAAATD